MAEKGENKILVIITICIILISILLSGCIEDDNDKSNNNKENSIICYYWYNIEINSSSPQYELNVPLPVYSDEVRKIHVSPVFEDLKTVQGIISFEIENTSFGPSLKINGSYNATFDLYGNDFSKLKVPNQDSNLFLSMALDKDNDGYYDDEYGVMKYRIFCYQNITMNIIIKFSYSYFGKPGIDYVSDSAIYGKIKQRWNIINGTFN